MPVISVITVCYNSAHTIADTLASVAGQQGAEFEHVVIDGASTDGTQELARKFRPPVTRLISEPDRGLYDAMNKGISVASGDYIGFLNADDVYADENVLARVAERFATRRCEAVHGDLLYVNETDTKRIVRYWKSDSHRPGMFEAGWHPAHPTLFVRTSVLREIGGFDTRYRYHADFDLMVRLFVERGITSVHIPEILVRMRTGGQSNRSLRNIYRGNRESYEIARRAGIAASPLWFARKLLYRLPQFLNRP